MIVFYTSKGEITGTIKGNYNISRHILENKNWIEVDNQPLNNKKVDLEREKLVEI